jgi:hypothetical protein
VGKGTERNECPQYGTARTRPKKYGTTLHIADISVCAVGIDPGNDYRKDCEKLNPRIRRNWKYFQYCRPANYCKVKIVWGRKKIFEEYYFLGCNYVFSPQQTVFFAVTAIRTSNPTKKKIENHI